MLQAINEQYNRLLTTLQAEIVRVQEFHRNVLRCRKGCCQCCQEISLLPVEAAVIRNFGRTFLPEGWEASHFKAPPGSCPFLRDRLCAIYQVRPIICRTHGLPVAYVDPEREVIEVSACPVNFEADYEFSPEGLLFLDPHNEKLRSLNAAYLRERGVEMPERIPLGSIFSRSDLER